MNYHDLYDQWQQAPVTLPSVVDILPSALTALAGLFILVMTFLHGDKRTNAWRAVGGVSAGLLAASSLALAFMALQEEPPERQALTNVVHTAVADQGVHLPETENNANLWQRLSNNGEATVDTPDGKYLLTVYDDGTLYAKPVEDDSSDE